MSRWPMSTWSAASCGRAADSRPAVRGGRLDGTEARLWSAGVTDSPTSTAAAAWHAMPVPQVLSRLASDASGLRQGEAEQRLERFGPNRIPEPGRATPLLVFLRQFTSPLIYLLLVAAVLSLLIGDLRDALFIFGVLVLNALVGGFQEWRADTSARALRSMIPHLARVRRSGLAREVPSEAVVPGDVVELESGMRVAADLRLLDSHGLMLDEGPLTGESLPVAKDAAASTAADAGLADRATMAHAGTTVAAGRASGVAVATGAETAVGLIGRSLEDVARASPLLRRLGRLSRQIAVGAVALIVV